MLRFFFTISVALVIIAIVMSRDTRQEPRLITHGRNKTVLFVTTEASGLSNVHLATSAALLEHHPDIEVHYASFPKLGNKVSSISTETLTAKPSAKSIQWHELPGPDFLRTHQEHWGDVDGMISGVGTTDYAKKTEDLVYSLAPWDAEDHWNIYSALVHLVDSIDPELIVLDNMLAPAKDFASNSDRKFISLVPNALLELIAAEQPRGAMFWKYPAAFTGFQFPVPRKLILTNIFLSFRLGYHLVTSPVLKAKRRFLEEKGIKNPIELSFVVKDIPVLASTIKEANFPMDFYPPYLTFCGPIAIRRTPAADQDIETVAWLKQAPTILINLGSLFAYNKERARIMANAIGIFLTGTDVQVLWKLKKLGEYGDEVFSSAQPYVDSGRLRIETWLKADPIALLETGHIVLLVHHGGANTYHEALLAGVPQMILPLWFDLYNIANAAEYLGIGIWAGRETTPKWGVETIVDGLRVILLSPKSVSIREKARELGVVARQYGGSRKAADEIAKLAAVGVN